MTAADARSRVVGRSAPVGARAARQLAVHRRRRRGRAPRRRAPAGSTRSPQSLGRRRRAERGRRRPTRSTPTSSCWPARPAPTPSRPRALARPRASRWCPPPTTSTTCAALLDLGPEAAARGVTVVGRRRLLARADLRAGPPRRRPASTGSTRSTWPRSGTGGPACARQHHRALGAARPSTGATAAGSAAPAGSGRELCWFPDPIGAADCYRAALPDALLLVPAFPGVQRVTARLAATRRDRLTARLPMLRPTAPRGWAWAPSGSRCGAAGPTARDVAVLGAMDRPAVAAGAVAALAAVVRRPGRAAPHRRRRAWPSWSSRCRSSPSWPGAASGPPSSRATPPGQPA